MIVAPIDEDALTVADPFETATTLAFKKAEAVGIGRALGANDRIIGADTVVALQTDGGWCQFGKPRDRDDARRILKSLSGKTHIVTTGVAVLTPFSSMSAHDVTYVTFFELTDAQIEAYIATDEPYDKAGAYAIQGGAEPFVREVEGSLTNVIGLPLELMKEILRATG